MSLHNESIIEELEHAVRSGTSDRRLTTLRNVTDLFLHGCDRFSEDQIKVFDDVLCLLISRIESRAKIELSKRFAAVESAPVDLIRALARDDDASVAGPVLEESKRLSTGDLIEIARTHGQKHLLAISGRSEIEQDITDIILARGEQEVVLKLARNTGARFSESGFATLSQRAEQDADLAESVGLRLDLPVKFLRELLARATKAVREKLLAAAPAGLKAEMERVLSAIGESVGKDAVAPRVYTRAEQSVRALFENDLLNENTVADFARKGEIEKLAVALALLSGMSVEMVAKLVQSPRTDTLLIPCKAAELSWPTVQLILKHRQRGHTVPADILALACADYGKLSSEVAQRTVRFWKVRETTDRS